MVECAHLLLPKHQNHNSLLNNHCQEDAGTHQRHLTSKDKEEATPRWQEGTIMIKSNPTPSQWANHKPENNNAKEVLPLL